MLANWLDAVLTTCSPSLRALGYLRELRNIRTSYRWWHAAWTPHLERTKAVLRSAIQRCSRRRKAVVLGAALLYDVPLTELSAAFEEVILVDVVHPFWTRFRQPRLTNVRRVNLDVSGVIDDVYRLARSPGAELPVPVPNLAGVDAGADLVASVNLLSQLPCLPTRYLTECGVHPPSAIEAFGHNVVRAHLDYLQQLPGTVALISDVETQTVSRQGDVQQCASTLHGVTLPWQGESWIWRLIPLRRTPPFHSEWLRVLGIADLKNAVRGG